MVPHMFSSLEWGWIGALEAHSGVVHEDVDSSVLLFDLRRETLHKPQRTTKYHAEQQQQQQEQRCMRRLFFSF